MSAVQIGAVVICVLLNALDGFDILSISFASPGIAEEWGIDRASLGVVLSMELIGMAIGSLLIGRAADKIGRRPTILGCLVIMAVGMLAAALAQSIVDLSIYRVATGIGIGGMLASTNAMVAEYANAKSRNMAVILMVGGYPLGIVLGGSVSAELLEYYDWRAVFYFGALVTALFVVLAWRFLPESVHFLIGRGSERDLKKANVILAKMGRMPVVRSPYRQGNIGQEVESILSPGLRRTTILLTLAYFAHIMTHYYFLKWIPKIVVDMGYIASTAGTILVWANVGAITSSVIMGALSHRFAMRPLTMLVLVACGVAITMFGMEAGSLTSLAILAVVAGFFAQASVVGLYALFVQYFPTSIRATGTGFAIGIGRGGAAVGPIAAGLLFSAGYGLQSVSVIMAFGSLLACLALFLISPPRRADAVPVSEQSG